MSSRPIVTAEQVYLALDAVRVAVFRRLEEKGYGTYASPHEAEGVLDEEARELKDAVRQNDPIDFAQEMADIAVVCVFAFACWKPWWDWLQTEEEYTAESGLSPSDELVHLVRSMARERG